MPSDFRRNEQLMLILKMLLEQCYSALWLLQSYNYPGTRDPRCHPHEVKQPNFQIQMC